MKIVAFGPLAKFREPAWAVGLGIGAAMFAALFLGLIEPRIAAVTGLGALALAGGAMILGRAKPTAAPAMQLATTANDVKDPLSIEIRESFARLGGVALCLSEADGRLTVIGRDAERIIGLSPSDYPRGTAHKLKVKDEYRDKLPAIEAGSVDDGRFVNVEYGAIDLRDGCDRWIAESRAALGNGKQLTLYFDRTREHDAERKMDLASLLVEDAKRGRTSFVANIDHEFRTPLNTIIGFSEIIQGEVLGPIGNDRYRGYVGDIHASGKLLLALVDRLLDLSKAESGTLVLEEEDSDLAAMLGDCVQLMRQAAERASIRLGAEVAKDLPHVYLDPHKFKRALLVLIDNAVKFTLSGGSVAIGVGRMADGALQISIADDGVGIPATDVARLLDATPVRHGQKIGLGLPLARSLAELHGGRLDIEPGRDRGTVVKLTLPSFRVISQPGQELQKRQEATPAPTNVLSATPPIHRRILCIDTDPVIPRAVRQSLRDAGDRSEVLWRDNPEAGLAAVGALKPDVVLVDWHLPDVSGRSLVDAIRGEPGSGGPPIVFLADIECDRQLEAATPGIAHRWLIKSDLTPANVKAALASAVAQSTTGGDTMARRMA